MYLPILWWVIYECTCPHFSECCSECSAVFLKRFYLFIFRERGMGRERGEKHQCVVASHMSLTGDLGICPDWALNQRPFGSQAHVQSIELHQPGIVFSSFWPKDGMTHMPHPLYSSNLTPSDFFLISLVENSLQKETFCQCGSVKQKMAEALKGMKIDEFKNCFEQWRKVSISVLHQMESTLKVTSLNMWE